MSHPWKPEKYQNEFRETMEKWLENETDKLGHRQLNFCARLYYLEAERASSTKF